MLLVSHAKTVGEVAHTRRFAVPELEVPGLTGHDHLSEDRGDGNVVEIKRSGQGSR